MKLRGIKVLENEGGAVPNRTQRPQSETIAVKDYVGNGRRWSEGIPAPKFIKGKLKEVFFSTLLSAIQAAINYTTASKLTLLEVENKKKRNKEIAIVLSQIVLKTIKAHTREFLAFEPRWIYDKGELEAKLADKYFTFIVSGVIAENFKEDE